MTKKKKHKQTNDDFLCGKKVIFRGLNGFWRRNGKTAIDIYPAKIGICGRLFVALVALVKKPEYLAAGFLYFHFFFLFLSRLLV